jgi:hypothetical protein
MDPMRIPMDETPTRASFEIRGHLHMAADLPRRWIVVPPSDRARALAHPLLEALLPSHVGFFPGARRHRVDRPEGVDQAIFKYCVAGEGWCQVGGRRFDVGAGDLMVVLGCAPKTYFERLRLHKAAGLLLTTGNSVKAIAGKMGYRDALYFSRTFRRVHGVSPSEYRRDHAGEAEPD